MAKPPQREALRPSPKGQIAAASSLGSNGGYFTDKISHADSSPNSDPPTGEGGPKAIFGLVVGGQAFVGPPSPGFDPKGYQAKDDARLNPSLSGDVSGRGDEEADIRRRAVIIGLGGREVLGLAA
ncbi:hypothetical protein SAMD00023353_0400080 [Rosellinia necatrix]|uniref:Uncharacterized protein n=1 Tax=Rosellinia necatrix TaxID=77044 RepID=A0A1S7UIH0_ROSNE|nr:hypothetical protein SAMD00023353_0400080 [Rosellinia necatrix]